MDINFSGQRVSVTRIAGGVALCVASCVGFIFSVVYSDWPLWKLAGPIGFVFALAFGLVYVYFALTLVDFWRRENDARLTRQPSEHSGLNTPMATPPAGEALPDAPPPIRLTDAGGSRWLARERGRDEYERGQRRVMALLRAAIDFAGADARQIPRFAKLGWSGEDWSETVSLLGANVVKQHNGTFTPGYSLGQLYQLVGEGRIRLALPSQSVSPNPERSAANGDEQPGTGLYTGERQEPESR